MVILGISIVLLVIMICGGIAYPLITKMEFKDRYRKSNIIEEDIKTLLITDMKRPRLISGLIIVISFTIIILINSISIIPTGYVGVRTVFGQVKETSAKNGFNWKIPFIENIDQVIIKQQDKKIKSKIWGETVSRTKIYYANTRITYKINGEKVNWIYANIADYENILTSDIVSSAIKASSKQLADEDATNRNKIEKLVVDQLQVSLNKKYGENVIYVNKVTIKDAEFEKSYDDAVAAKQQAIINQQTQETNNKTAIEKAKSDAEVKRVAAEGEKQANELLEKSITKEILIDKMLDKWDGKLPVVSGDKNSMFDITSLLPKE